MDMERRPPSLREGSPLKRGLAFALFLLVALGGGTLAGTSFAPGDWYAGLEKPWFNPPDWLFGPAWTVLYVLVAVAGWRVWDKGLERPFWRWFIQMAVNFAWPAVFFGGHWIGLALAVLVLLLITILLFIAETWNRDRVAALCFVPYACWVLFAGLLNAAIWWLN